MQRSSGSSINKTPNSSSRSQANYGSGSSRWYDRLQYPHQSTNDNLAIDDLDSRETTKVHHEECVDVGASNLKNGFSVSASEHVVKKCEELQLAEDTNDPPKTGMIDLTDHSVPHESRNCSSDLAKPVEHFDHVKGPPKTEPVGVLPNSSVKFGNFDEVPGLALPSDAFRDNNSSTKYMDDEDATQFRNELKDETKLEDEMSSITNADTSPITIHVVEAPTECNRNPLDICEIQDSPVVVSGSTTLADSVSLSSNNDPEVQVASSSVASIESQTLLRNRATVSVDLGGESAESKERFRQRLWCFLFENLNRAVDELYLLCELECDMEQINESILVLDEAISDFQELKSRAEHFDNTKKSPSLPKEGMPMAVKADHRRPHALSWEVCVLTSPSRLPSCGSFSYYTCSFCLRSFEICVYGCFVAFLSLYDSFSAL